MLTLRPEQLSAFQQAAIERFMDGLEEHVKEHFPRHVEVLGADGVRAIIHHAIDKARSHRIETEAGTRVYFRIMLLLGPDFDLDPRFSWASAALGAPADEATRVGALFEAAKNHFATLEER